MSHGLEPGNAVQIGPDYPIRDNRSVRTVCPDRVGVVMRVGKGGEVGVLWEGRTSIQMIAGRFLKRAAISMPPPQSNQG